MPEPNPIYAIVGNNGYGMTIKLEKVRMADIRPAYR
jgi:hypothetical protein